MSEGFEQNKRITREYTYNIMHHYFSYCDEHMIKDRDNFLRYLKSLKNHSDNNPELEEAINEALRQFDKLNDDDFNSLIERSDHHKNIEVKEEDVDITNESLKESTTTLREFILGNKNGETKEIKINNLLRCYIKVKLFDFEDKTYVVLHAVDLKDSLVSNNNEIYQYIKTDNPKYDYLASVNSSIIRKALYSYIGSKDNGDVVTLLYNKYLSFVYLSECLANGRRAIKDFIASSRNSNIDDETINDIVFYYSKWMWCLSDRNVDSSYLYFIETTGIDINKKEYINFSLPNYRQNNLDICTSYLKLLSYESRKALVEYLCGLIVLKKEGMTPDEYGVFNVILYN